MSMMIFWTTRRRKIPSRFVFADWKSGVDSKM